MTKFRSGCVAPQDRVSGQSGSISDAAFPHDPETCTVAKNNDAFHVARAKRVAKKLQRTLVEIEEPTPLSDCQEAVARMLGFSGWHTLSKAPSFALTPPDERLNDDDRVQRKQRQLEALVEHLPILQSFGIDATSAIVDSLCPSALAAPQSLLEAAARHELPADVILEGMESVGPVGPAHDLASTAHEMLDRDPREAERLARTALAIDPNCIDALELLGLVADDPVESVACHRRSAERAKVMYATPHRAWCERNPSDDPKLFWEFIGARLYIRSHMNLGRALVRAAEESAMDWNAALQEAESAFGHLVKMMPQRHMHDALDQRMMTRMLRGDSKGARKDAIAKERLTRTHNSLPDCWTVWTLAWADLAEGEPGTVSIARAIEVCPFALPLLLDGCHEPSGYGDDRNGPLAARAYAIEAFFSWQDTPGALDALKPFRAVADRRIAEAKRKCAETWGGALSPEHRPPIPEQWRV